MEIQGGHYEAHGCHWGALGDQFELMKVMEVIWGLRGVKLELREFSSGLWDVKWGLREVTWRFMDVTLRLKEATWGT